MGWLSLGSKILPKVWRAGVKASSTLWRGGSTVAGSTANIAGSMLRNPKTTAVVGASAYAGWKILNNPDKTAGTVVGQTAREAVDGTGSFAHDAVNGFTGENTVENVTDTATNVVNDLKDTVTESKGILGTIGDALGGISKFLGNLFGGNGTNMFGNFLDNLTSGKISGLGIGALIAAGYLIFGRSGIMGKIGGALLAMMMIGGNSKQVAQTESQSLAQSQSQDQQYGMHR